MCETQSHSSPHRIALLSSVTPSSSVRTVLGQLSSNHELSSSGKAKKAKCAPTCLISTECLSVHWLLTHSPHGRCRASRAASQAKRSLKTWSSESSRRPAAHAPGSSRGHEAACLSRATPRPTGSAATRSTAWARIGTPSRSRPAAARVPAKPPFRRKRDGLFYGPLAWKPLTHEECEREEMRRRDNFGSDGSDTE